MDELSIDGSNAIETSVFASNLSVEAKIERARMELLDLSARNRLLNVPRFSKSAKTIDIVEERATEVFRILVTEGKAMTFLAGAKGREIKSVDGTEEELIELALPDDDDRDESGRLMRHADTKLQTRMTPAALQKRLLDLYFDARTLEEEQGVNILFLGLGTLKWIDPKNPENIRYAPLVLVPVSLERGTATERFRLKARPEEFSSNLSLQAYLDREHTIKMPDFEPSDEFSLDDYAAKVAASIAIKPTWSVQTDDIVLGFFSFAKFLMYRDLDPALWPANARFTDRPLITSLVSNGFARTEELLAEDAKIDGHISPAEMTHIVDADSSQTVAIHEVRKGRDLVIQGPPGTGKSQTIANIIAAAVADGKTVLFVAEKMAALEVVKRRLDQAGVGDACLELHSNKANKRAVLAELRQTWELGAPKGDRSAILLERLTEVRDRLNAHPERLHRVHEPYNLSPYQVMGHLARLRRAGLSPSDIALPVAATWTPEAHTRIAALLSELGDRIKDIGRPIDHPWHGIGLTGISPLDLERLMTRIDGAIEGVGRFMLAACDLTGRLHRSEVSSVAEFMREANLANRIATCPQDFSAEALADPVWDRDSAGVARLVEDGHAYKALTDTLGDSVTPLAWPAETETLTLAFLRLPKSFPQESFGNLHALDAALPRFLHAAQALRSLLGVNASPTLGSIERLIVIGQRVADAPDASPDAFVAAIWERGLEQASDLAEAVATLRQIRADLSGKIMDQAWDLDLASARLAVAVHGKRLLRFASGEWRAARAAEDRASGRDHTG